MVDKSKQGIEVRESIVLKEHESKKKALLERKVAEIYSKNEVLPIKIPEYGEPFYENQKWYLPIEKIVGKSLMYNENGNITKSLVQDLALFHEMFSQNKNNLSSSVLYRDAITSNYLYKDSTIIHIDFSSSNKYLHSFDDLALLLHPLWNKTSKIERQGLVKEYMDMRHKFNRMNISSNDQIDMELISNQTTQEKIEYYTKSITSMLDSGIKYRDIRSELKDINFDKLRPKDFDFFFDYRTLRGEYYTKRIWG